MKNKGSMSREEHETGFSVLTTVELICWLSSQNPANNRLHALYLIHFSLGTKHELRAKIGAKSYKLRATYVLWVTRYELGIIRYEILAPSYEDKSYETRDKGHDKKKNSHPLWLMIVRYSAWICVKSWDSSFELAEYIKPKIQRRHLFAVLEHIYHKWATIRWNFMLVRIRVKDCLVLATYRHRWAPLVNFLTPLSAIRYR